MTDEHKRPTGDLFNYVEKRFDRVAKGYKKAGEIPTLLSVDFDWLLDKDRKKVPGHDAFVIVLDSEEMLEKRGRIISMMGAGCGVLKKMKLIGKPEKIIMISEAYMSEAKDLNVRPSQAADRKVVLIVTASDGNKIAVIGKEIQEIPVTDGKEVLSKVNNLTQKELIAEETDSAESVLSNFWDLYLTASDKETPLEIPQMVKDIMKDADPIFIIRMMLQEAISIAVNVGGDDSFRVMSHQMRE